MATRNLRTRSRSVLRGAVLQRSVLNAGSGSGLMLTPVALLAGVFGAWRFGVDLVGRALFSSLSDCFRVISLGLPWRSSLKYPRSW